MTFGEVKMICYELDRLGRNLTEFGRSLTKASEELEDDLDGLRKKIADPFDNSIKMEEIDDSEVNAIAEFFKNIACKKRECSAIVNSFYNDYPVLKDMEASIWNGEFLKKDQ